MARQNAAIHIGLRHLRQGVVRVASEQPRGHAGRMQKRVPLRLLRDARDGGRIRWSAQDRLDIGSGRSRLQRSQLFEVRARDGIQLKRELVVLQPLERVRKVVDGVVGHRQRTMAAGVSDHELIVGVELFAGIDVGGDCFAFLEIHSAAIGIKSEGGLHQLGMILQEPVDTIRLTSLFVCREREDEVAVRFESFFVQAQEGRHENGVAVFHILRAAPVIIAIFLDELKGIGGPVLTARFNDIFMPDEEDWRLRAGSAIADDQVFFAVVRAAEEDVGPRKARVKKTLLHRFRDGGDAAHRIRRVDVDDLAENAQRQLFGGGVHDVELCAIAADVAMIPNRPTVAKRFRIGSAPLYMKRQGNRFPGWHRTACFA